MILMTEAQYALLDELAGRERMAAMRVVRGDVSELQRQFNQEFSLELKEKNTSGSGKHNYSLRQFPSAAFEMFRITSPDGFIVSWCSDHISAAELCARLDRDAAQQAKLPVVTHLSKPGFIEAAAPVSVEMSGPDYDLLAGDRLAVEYATPGWQAERAGEKFFVPEDSFNLIEGPKPQVK
jgi:hypothetical protein